MTKYNETTKQAIYKWRETHHDEYKKYVAEKVNEHYHRNKTEILAKMKRQYLFKKEIARLAFLELF